MEIKSEEYNEYLKEEYLSVKEAAELLEVSEAELRSLVDLHEIPTHNIAGFFLRLKKAEIEALKNKWRIERELFPKQQPSRVVHSSAAARTSLVEKLSDFWYFNDFYIICSAFIVALLYFIISSQ